MKRGVALLIVLSFLIVLFVLVGAIFKIYSSFKDNFYKNISQNSMLIENLKNTLSSFEFNNSSFYNSFLISSKDGDFRSLIEIKPLLDRVDINFYKYKPKEILNYLDNILNAYNINDPIFFEDLIKDTFDKDKQERETGSEIVLNEPFFKQGKIYNYAHFKEILDYYYKKVGDKEIYKIPWKRLIYFSDGKNIIDCNIINEEVAKYLGLSWDNKLNCNSLNLVEENKPILRKFDIIPFSKAKSYISEVEIDYENVKLNIIYDFKQKRIKDIKSNFLY